MLCNTLLTLACTRTKRIQLENRFGSSLHTSSELFCFDAASFGRLYVIRVAQAFVSSFLFEVFLSNISVGLFGTCIFDHSLKSFVSQSGPFHHKEHSANSEGVAPLVHKLAGFSSVETCYHCVSSVNICISPIRSATNGRKSLPCPRIHHRTWYSQSKKSRSALVHLGL